MREKGIFWIIDNEQWPRACLRAELIERGHEAIGYETLSQALAALGRKAEPNPRVIVLELRGQNLTPADLKSLRNTRIPVVIMAGAVELADPLITSMEWTLVLARPVRLGAVADAVEEIARRSETHL